MSIDSIISPWLIKFFLQFFVSIVHAWSLQRNLRRTVVPQREIRKEPVRVHVPLAGRCATSVHISSKYRTVQRIKVYTGSLLLVHDEPAASSSLNQPVHVVPAMEKNASRTDGPGSDEPSLLLRGSFSHHAFPSMLLRSRRRFLATRIQKKEGKKKLNKIFISDQTIP